MNCEDWQAIDLSKNYFISSTAISNRNKSPALETWWLIGSAPDLSAGAEVPGSNPASHTMILMS